MGRFQTVKEMTAGIATVGKIHGLRARLSFRAASLEQQAGCMAGYEAPHTVADQTDAAEGGMCHMQLPDLVSQPSTTAAVYRSRDNSVTCKQEVPGVPSSCVQVALACIKLTLADSEKLSRATARNALNHKS